MTTTTTVITELAGRRRELGEAMSALERVATGPAADQERWMTAVVGELAGLREALVRHADLLDGDNGLFREIVEKTPRLAHRVDHVRAQYEEVDRAIEAVDRALRSPDQGPADVLEPLLALLAILTRHRLAISDLAWEAFEVDIGSTG